MNKYVYINSILILVIYTLSLIICILYKFPIPILGMCFCIGVYLHYSMFVHCAILKKLEKRKLNSCFGLKKIELEKECEIMVSSGFISLVYKYFSDDEILKLKTINIVESNNIFLTTLENGKYYMYYDSEEENIKKEIYGNES